jgi:hypothetical protein
MPALLMSTLDPVAVTIVLLCVLGAGFMIRFLVALLIDEKQNRAGAMLPKRRPHLVKSTYPRTIQANLVMHAFGETQRRKQG